MADEQVPAAIALGPDLVSIADPGGFPLIRLIRGKAAAFNAQLRQVARKHDCLHVDLWSMRVLADPRDWCEDRLHLASDGHRRVALRAGEVAGIDVTEHWREPLPPDPAGTLRWTSARQQDFQSVRTYAAPWLSRRLRGVSSGDGVVPKRPDVLTL